MAEAGPSLRLGAQTPITQLGLTGERVDGVGYSYSRPAMGTRNQSGNPIAHSMRRGPQTKVTQLGTAGERTDGVGDSYWHEVIGAKNASGIPVARSMRRPVNNAPAGSASRTVTYHMIGYFYERAPAVWDTWRNVGSPTFTPPTHENVRAVSIMYASATEQTPR